MPANNFIEAKHCKYFDGFKWINPDKDQLYPIWCRFCQTVIGHGTYGVTSVKCKCSVVCEAKRPTCDTCGSNQTTKPYRNVIKTWSVFCNGCRTTFGVPYLSWWARQKFGRTSK